MYLKRKLISLIIISVGILIPIVPKYEEYIHIKEEQKNIKKYFTTKEKSDYLMIIDIPKINLKKGIYNINDANNNVSKNIEILKDTNLKINSIFLASHSGTSHNAYFNNLKSLTFNDIIYIYYDNKKYTYIVNNMYYIQKNGHLKIENQLKNTLVLITCSTSHNDKQLIVTSFLDNITML